MALLTVAVLSRAGVDMAGTAATATVGDTFANTGAEIIEVFNGGGSPTTVTIDFIPTIDGNLVTDPTVTVAAGARKCIGPLPPAYFNDNFGLAKVTCSPVTSVTVKVLRQVFGG